MSEPRVQKEGTSVKHILLALELPYFPFYVSIPIYELAYDKSRAIIEVERELGDGSARAVYRRDGEVEKRQVPHSADTQLRLANQFLQGVEAPRRVLGVAFTITIVLKRESQNERTGECGAPHRCPPLTLLPSG
jgi:hypothetical protein